MCWQLSPSQRTRPLSKYKPTLYFPSVIRLPVGSNHWVPHHLHRQRVVEGIHIIWCPWMSRQYLEYACSRMLLQQMHVGFLWRMSQRPRMQVRIVGSSRTCMLEVILLTAGGRPAPRNTVRNSCHFTRVAFSCCRSGRIAKFPSA